MANQIPQYQDSVKSTPFAAPPEPRAINVTEGLTRGLGAVAKEARAVEKRNAELEAEQALQGFVRETNSLLLTGENAYYGTQGETAVKGAGQVIQSIEEIKRKYLGQVKDPDAARLLSKSIESRITSERARIQTHALKGQKEWDLSLAKTGAEQAAENASLYVGDPVRVQAAALAIEQNLRVSMEGMPEESIKEARDNLLSKALAAGISNEISRSPSRGKALLEQYRDKLEVGELRILETKLKKHTDLQRVAAAVAEIQTSAPGDLKAQIEQARKRFGNDIELQDQLKRRLKDDYNLDKSIETEAKRKVYESIADDLLIRKIPWAQLQETRSDELLSLDVSQYTNLEKIASSLAKGEVPKTDWAVWTRLKLLSDAELRKVNPLDYYTKLEPTKYDKLLDMVRKAREGKESGAKPFRTAKSIIDHYLGEDEQAKFDASKFIDGQIMDFYAKEGRDPNPIEINHMLDQYFMTRKFKNYNLYESFDKTSLANTDIDNVPPEDVKLIKQALATRGITDPSDEQIVDLWRKRTFRKLIGHDKLNQWNALQRQGTK